MVVLFCVSANLIENHSKHENENMFFMCFFKTRNTTGREGARGKMGVPGRPRVDLGPLFGAAFGQKALLRLRFKAGFVNM